MAGSSAGMLSVLANHPLDVVKMRLQGTRVLYTSHLSIGPGGVVRASNVRRHSGRMMHARPQLCAFGDGLTVRAAADLSSRDLGGGAATVQDGHNPSAPLYRGFVHALKTIAREEVCVDPRPQLGFGDAGEGAWFTTQHILIGLLAAEARVVQGLRGMYAGLSPNLVGASVSWGVYFYR